MQYVLFYNPVFVMLFVCLFSPHLLLYNTPNIYNAINRLLTFQLPLSYYLLTECQSHMQNVFNTGWGFFYPLQTPGTSLQVHLGNNYK